jgi:hypothetical protein
MDEQKYWFRAKRYGWGWGLPITWQSWAVLGLWFAALILGRRYLVPHCPGELLELLRAVQS